VIESLTLTAMEVAILRGLANGLQSKEIALSVRRSPATIELHVRTLFAKFNARSRAHLVVRALLLGALGFEELADDHRLRPVGLAGWQLPENYGVRENGA
jgi:DNA-binding CsgD family transcriptional regulator